MEMQSWKEVLSSPAPVKQPQWGHSTLATQTTPLSYPAVLYFITAYPKLGKGMLNSVFISDKDIDAEKLRLQLDSEVILG